MPPQCPNCRRRVSFLRTFSTSALGSFPCPGCGSVLTISFARRIMAAVVWLVLVIGGNELLRVDRWGRLIGYTLMAASLVGILYLFEKIVVIDRRAFTCRECGYDLQGLPEPRCPECGTPFDDSEIARIRARIGLPITKPRRRWPVVIAVVLLALSVAAGFIAWQNAAAPRPTSTPATTSAPAP